MKKDILTSLLRGIKKPQEKKKESKYEAR